MAKYRGKNNHRPVHPKIFIWTHTKKAEIEYFKSFKDHFELILLIVDQKICATPWILIKEIIKRKNSQLQLGKISEEDNDQVWCVFDVDDFYQEDSKKFLQAITDAHRNNIRIAYTNECFELLFLLHFEKPNYSIARGDEIEKKIQQAFKKNQLGDFKKNQNVFKTLLPFQDQAIKNARGLIPKKYIEINWANVLHGNGNPSTSVHFLIEEIKRLIRNKI